MRLFFKKRLTDVWKMASRSWGASRGYGTLPLRLPAERQRGSQMGGGCNENGKDGTIGEIQRSRTRAGPGDCLEVGQWEEGSRLHS